MAAAGEGPRTGGVRRTLDMFRNRRALRVLMVAGAVMMALGVSWTVLFAWFGAWVVAGVELCFFLIGLALVVMVRRGYVRGAGWVAFVGLFLLICTLSLFIDVPSPGIPRTAHLFLLVIGVGTFQIFRGERPWLRYGAVGVLFVAFVLFAAIPEGIPGGIALDDGMRRYVIWINLVTLVASLMLILWQDESDRAEHDTLHGALRDALSRRHFELFYQPQTDASGRVVGAEALLRWRDPKRGLVLPVEFVPVAEDTGFILPLGQWVLDSACRQLRLWQDTPHLQHLRLSVNVSALQLQQPDFVERVLDALHRRGADPGQLTLELTENELLEAWDEVVHRMHMLTTLGIRLSADDFGAEYSSLSHLHHLPFAELKIDRAFVAAVPGERQWAGISPATCCGWGVNWGAR